MVCGNYMLLYVYTYTHVCLHDVYIIHIHTRAHLHTYTCMFTCMYIRTHSYGMERFAGRMLFVFVGARGGITLLVSSCFSMFAVLASYSISSHGHLEWLT